MGGTYIYSDSEKQKVFLYELRFHKKLLCIDILKEKVDTIVIDSLWKKAEWYQTITFYKDEKAIVINLENKLACLNLNTGEVRAVDLDEIGSDNMLRYYYPIRINEYYCVDPESLLVLHVILRYESDSVHFNLDLLQDFMNWEKAAIEAYSMVVMENAFDDGKRKIRFLGKGLMKNIMRKDQDVGLMGLMSLIITRTKIWLADGINNNAIFELNMNDGSIENEHKIKPHTLKLSGSDVRADDVFKNKEVRFIRKQGYNYVTSFSEFSCSTKNEMYVIKIVHKDVNNNISFSFLIYDKSFNKVAEIPFFDNKFIPRASFISSDGLGFFMYQGQNSTEADYVHPQKYRFAVFDFSGLLK